MQEAICVIGSGPVGTVAALKLLEAGFKVTMVDIGAKFGDLEPERSMEAKLINRFRLKTFWGSAFSYDLNEFNQLVEENYIRSWFTSKGYAGFSKIWGATWPDLYGSGLTSQVEGLNELNNLYKIGINASSKNLEDLFVKNSCECFHKILQRIQYASNKNKSNISIDVNFSNLVVNYESCTFCGLCQKGCPENAIWNSEELLMKCKEFDDFEYINALFVKRFEEVSSKVRIYCDDLEMEFDNLFIGAGPVSTSILFLKSDSRLNSVELKDNQMAIIPFLSFKRNRSHLGAFSLSGLQMNLKSNSSQYAHLQLYTHTQSYLDRILLGRNPILRALLRRILIKIQGHLYVGLMYLPAEISDSLKLELVAGIPITSSIASHAGKRNYILQILRGFHQKTGLFPIFPLIEIKEVGASYHLGSAKGLDLDEFGKSSNHQKVRAIGSIALQNIEPGPITAIAMAQAITSVNNFLLNLPKL